MNNSDIGKVDLTSPHLSPSPSNQQLTEGSVRRSARLSQRQSQQQSPVHSSSQSSQHSSIQSTQLQSPQQSTSQYTPLSCSTLLERKSSHQSQSNSSVKSAQQSPAQTSRPTATRHPSSSTVSSMEEDSRKVASIPEVESLIDDLCSSVNVFNVLCYNLNENDLTYGKEIGRGTRGSVHEVFLK